MEPPTAAAAAAAAAVGVEVVETVTSGDEAHKAYDIAKENVPRFRKL